MIPGGTISQSPGYPTHHVSKVNVKRYTIRAGRNLPDKEFRYLRTVIVTAAVYRGFISLLLPNKSGMTTPLNLPAPGRCQTLYLISRFCKVMCFC